MSTEDNKALESRTLEGWNEGNLAVFDEVIAPDYLYHDPDAPTIRSKITSCISVTSLSGTTREHPLQ